MDLLVWGKRERWVRRQRLMFDNSRDGMMVAGFGDFLCFFYGEILFLLLCNSEGRRRQWMSF